MASIPHQFGGNWTQEELARLQKYLPAYTTIFTRNQWAQQYTTHYVDAFAGNVDAFAGTGSRVEQSRECRRPIL